MLSINYQAECSSTMNIAGQEQADESICGDEEGLRVEPEKEQSPTTGERVAVSSGGDG